MECFNASCLTPTTGTAPNTFVSALQFFAAAQCVLTEGLTPDPEVENFDEFDFIIVGAGTAGSVLANRLSAINEWKVLLIEAGDDDPIEAKIPRMDRGMANTKYDWRYLTSNNGITNGANINGSINWPRGRMMGGSSNLNAMIYVQGSDQNYQDWFDAGNKEWSVDEVRRCFRKAESFKDTNLLKNPNITNHYGHNGPLVISTFNYTRKEISKQVLAAWDEIGIKNVPDVNVANMFGSATMRATAADGLRQSHNRAYLYPILNRKNLKILKNSLVTKVLVKGLLKVKKAYGVEVHQGSKKYRFFATKEVIVSAGAINSPQLLMLSGIGPQEHLLSKDIPVIVNSPMVGQNLQDHVSIPITIYGDGPSMPEITDQQFDAMKYLYDRSGSLAHNNLVDILAFYSELKNDTFPKFQSHLSMILKNNTNLRQVLTGSFRYKDQVANPIINHNINNVIYLHLFNLLHPYSKGNISLSSNNPYDYPVINPNYFSDPRDLELAATGIKILTRVVNTKPFRAIRAFLGRMEWPACDVYELDSRDYWKCVCINMVLTIYHPVGTCKMGQDPSTSVVDSRLRVHGVKNLRVIDASIMPSLTSGNTNGPVTAIGERGAELVLEDYNIESS